ncbi:NADPH:quinone oxidoreductase family protein [Bacillus sp. PS06]|uniref:NADPH:quinone oxidoreductase family protein n=1 Tax=Bacillus sp. PS06 TaxID=2764176 RepID=UPI001783D1EA|nr:acryloyl-CoA reductase [Bacillus sp. PS06]MBD8068526.1 acryloyl-CoA reductase [Bacillus sp. PS06]
MTNFKALIVDKTESTFELNMKEIRLAELPEGDVLIKVAYSSVNYKDGLASIPDGNIVSSYPFIPGIDLAGTVVSSNEPSFQIGDPVIVTSYELGVSHFGGYSEYARVPAAWVVPLPKGLSLKEAMIYGTAGFTAALSIDALERNGLTPQSGKVLVTGATGGVGSMAVSMLAQRGYTVAASTGKDSEHEYLKRIGAAEVLRREETSPEKVRALGKQHWAGAVDPVGGKTLAYVLSTTKYGGSVAVSGLTGGAQVPTTVFPFILRGVNLLGIDSVNLPMDKRIVIWDRISTDLHIQERCEEISREILFEELPDVLPKILNGEVRGRTVVKIS